MLKPVVPARDTTMPPAFHDEAGYREGLLAGMLEHDVHVALAGDVSQMALPNLRASFSHSAYSGELTVGIWPST